MAISLVACSGAEPVATAPDSSPPTSTALSGPSTVATVTTGNGSPSELDGITEVATAALADRLGVENSSIEVVVAESLTWPDGRLGCPDLDLPYTLEPVEGFRVVLGHEGRLYHFHVGSDASPRLCEDLTRRSDGPGSPEPSIPPPIK